MKITVTITLCNFPFGKPSSVPGNSYTAHILKGICFTAVVMNFEPVFLKLSVQARTWNFSFIFFGKEVRSNSRKWPWWFFFPSSSFNVLLVSINPPFNSRSFKIFAEYVTPSWQLLAVGKVLYFAAKQKKNLKSFCNFSPSPDLGNLVQNTQIMK